MKIKLPYPKYLDKTSIKINITEGIDGNGAPKVVFIFNGKCRFVKKTKTIRDKNGQSVSLKGSIFICGDISPDTEILEGEVIIDNNEYKIHEGVKVRNPDNSVNHTKLELK